MQIALWVRSQDDRQYGKKLYSTLLISNQRKISKACTCRPVGASNMMEEGMSGNFQQVAEESEIVMLSEAKHPCVFWKINAEILRPVIFRAG
jgi:hypothetical protein